MSTARREGHHRSHLQRSLAWLHAFLLAAFAVQTLGFANFGSQSFVSGHLVLAAGEFTVAALTVVHGERAWYLLLLGPLVGFGTTQEFAGPSDGASGLILSAFCLGAVLTLRARLYIPLALVAGASYYFGRYAFGSPPGLNETSTVVVVVGLTLLAGAFVSVLERSTTALDKAEAATRAGLRLLAERTQQENAVDEARRILHDEVLTALRAVHAGPESETYARELCAAAVAAVQQMEDQSGAEVFDAPALGVTVDELVSDLRAASPVEVQVNLRTPHPGVRVDNDWERAVRRAAAEALRNVHRHAGVATSQLDVLQDAGYLSVTVTDAGCGIPPRTPENEGMRDSIRRAVTKAGGRVTVISDPSGTSVRLEFGSPARSRADAHLAEVYELTMSAGGQRILAWSITLPLMTIWLTVGALHIPDAPLPILRSGLLLAISGTAVLIARRLAKTAPSAGWVLWLAAALAAEQVLGLVSTEPGGGADYRSWPTGYLGGVLLVIFFVLPAWGSLLLMASQVAIVLIAFAVSPALTHGEFPVGSVGAVTAVPALTVLLGLLLRRNGRAVEHERTRRWAAEVELAAKRMRGEVSSLHLEHTRKVVVPWLRRFAGGQLDPRGVQEQARLLALETRDDLHAPGFHDPELRDAVTDYRRRGGVVDIRPGFAPGAHGKAIGQVLRSLVQVLPDGHQIRLSPSTGPNGASGSGPVRLAMIPPPPADCLHQASVFGAVIAESDEFLVVLSLSDVWKEPEP